MGILKGPWARAAGVIMCVLLLAVVGWGVLARWNAGIWLGVLGLAVSVAGFSVAIVEIRHTRGVAEATSRAVKVTLKAVAAGRLAVAITQLRQLVIDLEQAIEDDDTQSARQCLNSWRYVGADAAGLIERRFGDGHDALTALARSIHLASDAKSSLFDAASVRDATADCVDSMDKASDALGPLLEQIHPTMEVADA